jgi:hypothetical protein
MAADTGNDVIGTGDYPGPDLLSGLDFYSPVTNVHGSFFPEIRYVPCEK